MSRLDERIAARNARRAELAAQQRALAPIEPPPKPIRDGRGPESPFVNPLLDRPLQLSGLFQGAACFLILSGPSASTMDLSPLARRGIITMGVNNSPAIVRTNLWVHVDPPHKFHEAIWRDPGCLKFFPWKKRDSLLQHKGDRGFSVMTRDGSPTSQQVRPRDTPNSVGYLRNASFNPDQWLSERTINWGNDEQAVKKNGHPHRFNVMLAALKILYAVGVRTVYLVGCDFKMSMEQPYAFDEGKSARAVQGNNKAYADMSTMLGMLQPKFLAASFRVLNCTPGSGLTVFPKIDFNEAVDRETSLVPQDPLDTFGWYAVAGG